MKTMLYAHPGPHKIHGGMFDYVIVDDDEIDAHLKVGWTKTTTEALEAAMPQEEKPKRKRRTKAEMEADNAK